MSKSCLLVELPGPTCFSVGSCKPIYADVALTDYSGFAAKVPFIRIKFLFASGISLAMFIIECWHTRQHTHLANTTECYCCNGCMTEWLNSNSKYSGFTFTEDCWSQDCTFIFWNAPLPMILAWRFLYSKQVVLQTLKDKQYSMYWQTPLSQN